MRKIAKEAGITVGNIYAYFSGKEDLLETILTPVLEELNKLVMMESRGGENLTPSIALFTESITGMFLAHKKQFLILMNGSSHSKFANARTELTVLVRQRLITDLLPKLPSKAKDPLLADTLAVAVIEGILNIFRKYGGEKQRLHLLLEEFLQIIFNDIGKRINI